MTYEEMLSVWVAVILAAFVLFTAFQLGRLCNQMQWAGANVMGEIYEAHKLSVLR